MGDFFLAQEVCSSDAILQHDKTEESIKNVGRTFRQPRVSENILGSEDERCHFVLRDEAVCAASRIWLSNCLLASWLTRMHKHAMIYVTLKHELLVRL